MAAGAQAAENTVCDTVAAQAAARHGVPLDVMRAVTRVETGHRRDGSFTPWPWTTNVAGKGAWHDTRAAARRAILAAQSRGQNSIDIGCFQINLRWHGHEFSGIDEMLDPQKNAEYAARFLSQLHREFGNWTRAVGAFHSRTERFASRYRAKYRDVLAQLPPAATSEPHRITHPPRRPQPVMETKARQTNPVRENRYPLLQNNQPANATRLPGSLVPTGIGTSPLFGEG